MPLAVNNKRASVKPTIIARSIARSLKTLISNPKAIETNAESCIPRPRPPRPSPASLHGPPFGAWFHLLYPLTAALTATNLLAFGS